MRQHCHLLQHAIGYVRQAQRQHIYWPRGGQVHDSPKVASSHWGSGAPSNTWFRLICGSLGPLIHPVQTPNGTSIGSAIFAWLTVMTNRQIQRPCTCTTVGPHLCIATLCMHCELAAVGWVNGRRLWQAENFLSGESCETVSDGMPLWQLVQNLGRLSQSSWMATTAVY